ncbi:MAG TPA: MFS transporter [Stellaceae bacterium]|nr:MFS transporter [Stellaceae bacterium]
MSTEQLRQDAGAPPAASSLSGTGAQVTWRQWYMVLVLTLLAVFAFIDRQSLVLLVGPIKQDLAMTDTQMSLLLGGSFATFYGVLGLPAGYLVDRVSRRGIMGIGVVLWSAMTFSCGMAGSYTQLFLGRCGVGIGEAAITPASYSLIRDSFPPDNRARAFGVFSAAGFIGQASAVILTGIMIGFIAAGGLKGVPFLGTLRTWQAVLVVVGLVGFPLSLLTLTFREPLRFVDGSRQAAGVSFGEALAHLRKHWQVYLPLTVFATCYYAQASSYGVWMATVIARTWGLKPQQIGPLFGGELLILAPLGAWFGGLAIDRLTRRGRQDAAPVVGVWTTLVFVPLVIAPPVVPGLNQMWVSLGVSLLIAAIYYPVSASLLAQITPQRLMGKVTAIYLLVFTLLGLGMGPTLVAAISDNFFTGPQAIGYALGTASGCLITIALAMALVLLRAGRRGLFTTE